MSVVAPASLARMPWSHPEEHEELEARADHTQPTIRSLREGSTFIPAASKTVDDDLGRTDDAVKLEDDPLRTAQRMVFRAQ